MPYAGPGKVHDVIATKACVHGQIVVEEKRVGRAFKNTQLGAFVDPTLAAATAIPIGETMSIITGGRMEAPRTGALAAAVAGDTVFIKASDNSLALTNTGATATWYPVGVVDHIDTDRSPSVLRIDADMAAMSGKVNP